VGTRARSSARNDSMNGSAGGWRSATVSVAASRYTQTSRGDPRESAGLLLPSRPCGDDPLPSTEEVRGLGKADHQGGETREGERGPRDDSGVQDGRFSERGHRVARAGEPIAEERELEPAEGADPR